LIIVVICAVALSKLVPMTGRETIVIGGRSMEPAVPLGAAVVIEPVDPTTLAAGDIVSLRAGPQHALFTHRIVAVVDRPDGRWLRTKGDANGEDDPTLVSVGGVVGRAEAIVPWAGYLIVLLSVPTGLAFVIGLLATLLAAGWLLESLASEQRSRRQTTPAVTDGKVTAIG
jgi:signal peptidase I